MKLNKKFYLLHDILKKFDIIFDKKKIDNIKIKNVSDVINAKKFDITFFSKIQYLEFLKTTKASVVIVPAKFVDHVPLKTIPLLSKKPEIDFMKISTLFYSDSYYSKIEYKNLEEKEINSKYKNIKYGINFYLERNVKIGKNVLIGNNVTIKNNTTIGNNVIIGSNVIIEKSEIFDNVHICDGSIIGKKGFGFKFIDNKCLRVPHIGKVIIKNGCEIGANCVIDRGSISNTVIGEDTFIDNLVQIAHNVVIGKRCILASQVGVAGSTKIGNNVVIGGQAGISGHITIGNNVRIGGKSGVIKNIKDNEVVMGYPAVPFREFVKNKK